MTLDLPSSCYSSIFCLPPSSCYYSMQTYTDKCVSWMWTVADRHEGAIWTTAAAADILKNVQRNVLWWSGLKRIEGKSFHVTHCLSAVVDAHDTSILCYLPLLFPGDEKNTSRCFSITKMTSLQQLFVRNKGIAQHGIKNLKSIANNWHAKAQAFLMGTWWSLGWAFSSPNPL